MAIAAIQWDTLMSSVGGGAILLAIAWAVLWATIRVARHAWRGK